MDIFALRDFCLSLPLAQETTPFDETTLVYKIEGKMFLMVDMEDPSWINVKCDPDRALELRERYPEVSPGYHMSKRHWNTIQINRDLPEKLICKWIYDSYLLVVSGLSKHVRERVLSLQEPFPSTFQSNQ